MRRTRVAILVLPLLCGALVSCRDASTTPVVHLDTPRQPVSSTQLPTDPAKPEVQPCSANRTRIAVALTDSVMSQPFADIAVTNVGARSCLLKGYPRIKVWGHAGTEPPTRSHRLSILIRHGIYERSDHGARRVVLQPHDRAFFSIGTGVAYQGGLHPIAIRRIAVTLPGAHAPKMLAIDLVATRPPGRKIPVGITALSPPTAASGLRGERVSVPSHCGVLSVWVKDHLWIATPALGDHNPPRGWEENETPGRFIVSRHGRAVFHADSGQTARFRLAKPGESDPNAGCE